MIYEKPYALVAEDGEVLASGEAKELLEEIRKKTISDYKEEKFDLQTKLDCFEGFLDPNERVFEDQGEGKIPRLLASTNRMEMYKLREKVKHYKAMIDKYEKAKIVMEETSLELFFRLAKEYCTLWQEKRPDGKRYLKVGIFNIEVNYEQYAKLVKLFDELAEPYDERIFYKGDTGND